MCGETLSGIETAVLGLTAATALTPLVSKPDDPGSVSLADVTPRTPARSATQRKEDTGAKIRIGADAADKRLRSTRKQTTATKTGTTGLNIGITGTGVRI